MHHRVDGVEARGHSARPPGALALSQALPTIVADSPQSTAPRGAEYAGLGGLSNPHFLYRGQHMEEIFVTEDAVLQSSWGNLPLHSAGMGVESVAQ